MDADAVSRGGEQKREQGGENIAWKEARPLGAVHRLVVRTLQTVIGLRNAWEFAETHAVSQ